MQVTGWLKTELCNLYPSAQENNWLVSSIKCCNLVIVGCRVDCVVMNPERRHADENQINELSFKVCRLTSELFDEDANLEAPTDLNRCHFLKATNEENSASSGYISGASNNSPFHGTVEFREFVPNISGKSDSCSEDLNLINNTNKSKPYYRRSLSAESPPRLAVSLSPPILV